MAMMTRITTNMVMRNYQNNLTSTLGGLESTRKQVETGRRFSNSYEEPASAAKAAILERRYARNADYLDNVTNIQKWQDVQEDVVTSLSEAAREIEKNYSVQAFNDTNGELSIRQTFAQTLRSMQESMVNTLNAKYGDTFVMAGNAGTEPPFSLGEVNGEQALFYRGINVNSADPDDQAALEKFAAETSYIDLGFGLSFAKNPVDGTEAVDPSSAFNSALPGINVVGYGQDADGTPKNMILLIGKMADALEKDVFDRDAYEKAWTAFGEGSKSLRDDLASIGVKTQLLTSTEARLKNEKLAIETQFDKAVNIEPAEAIMNYSWANYAYNTALKVGTSIITPSLLDFMK